MKCINCNNETIPGDSFCRVCGVKLENNTFVNGGTTTNPDTELVDAYIGKNVEAIRKQDFSWATFFWGVYYAIYRKMWLLAVLWFVIIFILVLFLPSLSSFVGLVLNIIVCIKFKEWYVKHAEENVQKIKNNNPHMNHEQLLEVCRRKGGTSVIALIIFVLLFIVFIVAVVFVVAVILAAAEMTGEETENQPSNIPEENNGSIIPDGNDNYGSDYLMPSTHDGVYLSHTIGDYILEYRG